MFTSDTAYLVFEPLSLISIIGICWCKSLKSNALGIELRSLGLESTAPSQGIRYDPTPVPNFCYKVPWSIFFNSF